MAKDKDGVVSFSFSGKYVSYTHTIFAYAAFVVALIIALKLHYHKVVQNEFFGYPQEWFPSVSASIGDRYPERSIFQFFIALTSGPRLALCLLWYLLTARGNNSGPKFLFTVGTLRTLFCGGWVYITSTDDHDWHDIFMIGYLVLTLPWTIGCLALTPAGNAKAIKYRKIFAGLFFGTLVPLIYYFIQHKVHRVPGAYTKYAFLEWSLILYDVSFDAVTALDFAGFELQVVDVKGISKGKSAALADVVEEKTKVSKNQKQVAQMLATKWSWNDFLDTMADVYNGFVFWTTLTSLGVTVWYFPLWSMGLSGFEAIIMASVAPVLLGIPPLRRFITNNTRIFHLLALTGICSYIIERPIARLFGVGVGVFYTCLAWPASFFAERSSPVRLDRKIVGFSLGLMLSSIAKFWNHTNNPVWPIVNEKSGGYNKTGIALAFLAVLRSTGSVSIGAGNGPATLPGKNGSSLFSAFGLGGLIFALHSLLSDSSTMISWVWDGYPVKGPLAVPHGAVVLMAMGAGFLIGILREDWARSWTAYGLGFISAGLLVRHSEWVGFYGALGVAAYLMAILPSFIQSAVRHAPGRTFGLAFLIYNFLVLAHCWTVAYAFVPAGWVLRERTDVVTYMNFAFIGLGVFSAISLNNKNYLTKARNELPVRRRFRSYAIYTLIILELLSVAIAYLRFPTYDFKPYNAKDKVITAGIWTVHFDIDNDMWSSERRMRDLLKEMEVDVFGLLESDLQRIIMGNRDMTQFFAEDLGMYADFGPGPNKHTWGAALLSKFPIVNSTHHLLPSPVGELAPAIHATLDVYGELVDVVVFHSGQEEDVEDRRLQSLGVEKIMGDSPRPLILLSYLVTKPKQGNYNTYVSEKSRMKDIDPSDWDRWCEYILYRGLKRIGYARVSRDSITDTELQVGKFVIGDKSESTNEIIPESEIPESLRFPSLFKGKGVRGHFYHVFAGNEPRYYK